MLYKKEIRKMIEEWILPPQILYFIRSWIIPFLRTRNFSTLRMFEKKTNRLFVLATGPSLNDDLKRYRNDIISNDSLVMNMFATSPLFKELKPRIYLLADPLWFKSSEVIGKSTFKHNYETLLNALLENVNWKLDLIVPDYAINSDLVKSLKENVNIKVLFYNSRSTAKGKLGLWLMKKGWVAPPAQTVANVAAGLGVFLKYTEVWMLGIDTSMHTMMRVDQITNEMWLENTHFYGKKREKGYRDADKSKAYTVSYFLGCAVKMFEGYERIREFADYCKVRVVNASSFSWVDSLERPKNGCIVQEGM